MASAHELLTDEGCYVHEHFDADFDDGDDESGPGAGGHDEYDLYSGDSHELIFQRGLLVDTQVIDWELARYFERIGAETRAWEC